MSLLLFLLQFIILVLETITYILNKHMLLMISTMKSMQVLNRLICYSVNLEFYLLKSLVSFKHCIESVNAISYWVECGC